MGRGTCGSSRAGGRGACRHSVTCPDVPRCGGAAHRYLTSNGRGTNRGWGKNSGPLGNAGRGGSAISGLQPGDAGAGEGQQQHPNAGGPAFSLLLGVTRAEGPRCVTCPRGMVWAAAGEFVGTQGTGLYLTHATDVTLHPPPYQHEFTTRGLFCFCYNSGLSRRRGTPRACTMPGLLTRAARTGALPALGTASHPVKSSLDEGCKNHLNSSRAKGARADGRGRARSPWTLSRFRGHSEVPLRELSALLRACRRIPGLEGLRRWRRDGADPFPGSCWAVGEPVHPSVCLAPDPQPR